MTNNPTDLFFRSSKKRKTVIRGTGKKRLLSFLGVGQDCCARSVGAKKKKRGKVAQLWAKQFVRRRRWFVSPHVKGCPLRLFFCNWTCLASIILTDDSSLSTNISRRKGGEGGKKVIENKTDVDRRITLYIYIYISTVCDIQFLRQGICKKIGSCNYLNEW